MDNYPIHEFTKQDMEESEAFLLFEEARVSVRVNAKSKAIGQYARLIARAPYRFVHPDTGRVFDEKPSNLAVAVRELDKLIRCEKDLRLLERELDGLFASDDQGEEAGRIRFAMRLVREAYDLDGSIPLKWQPLGNLCVGVFDGFEAEGSMPGMLEAAEAYGRCKGDPHDVAHARALFSRLLARPEKDSFAANAIDSAARFYERIGDVPHAVELERKLLFGGYPIVPGLKAIAFEELARMNEGLGLLDAAEEARGLLERYRKEILGMDVGCEFGFYGGFAGQLRSAGLLTFADLLGSSDRYLADKGFTPTDIEAIDYALSVGMDLDERCDGYWRTQDDWLDEHLGELDPLWREAARFITGTGKADAASLQERFGIGSGRAEAIMGQMESLLVVRRDEKGVLVANFTASDVEWLEELVDDHIEASGDADAADDGCGKEE